MLAETLAQLELMRISSPTNSLAANGGSLMDRITRILDNRVRTKETNKHKMKIQTLGVIAAAALLVGGITNVEAKDTKKAQISKKQPAKAKLNNNAVIKKIKAAVGAGKLTKKEAAEKIAILKKELGSKKKGNPKSKYNAVIKKIKAAVGSGKLTKKEAAEKIAILKKKMGSKKKGKSKKTKSKRK